MRRVGVVGAGGRMGQEVCRAVAAAPDLDLVAAIDPGHVGEQVTSLTVLSEVTGLADARAEVVVDFSVAEALRTNLPYYAEQGIHTVVGTTGLSDAELEAAA